MGAVTFLASDASLYVTVSSFVVFHHAHTDRFRAPIYASMERTRALKRTVNTFGPRVTV
jgi:hypothetical protein